MKITGTIKERGPTGPTYDIDLDLDIGDLSEMLQLLLPVKTVAKRRSKKVEAPEEQTEPVDAETAAQDDADEAAENESDAVTVDDVRDAVLTLALRFGHDVAVKNRVQSIIGAKITDLETEDQCKAAIEAINAVVNEPATKDDLREAIREYAEVYDGQCDDLSKAKLTCEDLPKVLEAAVGVSSINKVADKDFAKAVVAVRAAAANNLFGRKRVGKAKE